MSPQQNTPAPGDPVAEHARTVDRYAEMVAALAFDILAGSAPQTYRACRHCGDSAAITRLQNESLCPVGESFGHSFIDMPVSS